MESKRWTQQEDADSPIMTRSLCPDRNSSINQLSDGLLWNFVQACIVCRGGVYICGSERNNSTTSGSLAMKFTSDVQCPFMNMTQVIVWLFPLVPRTFLFLSFFFIYVAQNHNHIASVGSTICKVNNILCPQILDLTVEKLATLKKKNL